MTEKQPTDALVAGVEDYLAELSDDDFDALIERVRPPVDDNLTNPATKPAARSAKTQTARGYSPTELAAQIPR